MRKVLLKAAGKAALKARAELECQDIWQIAKSKKTARSIGFTAQT
jgi:hypothetical protein